MPFKKRSGLCICKHCSFKWYARNRNVDETFIMPKMCPQCKKFSWNIYKKYTSCQLSNLERLYLVEKLSSNDIAKIKNCTVNFIIKALKGKGIKIREKTEITPRMHSRLTKAGIKLGEYKKKLYIDKYNYDNILTREVLFDLYVNKGISIPKIAKMFSCGVNTVYYRLRDFNISRRSLKEVRKYLVTPKKDTSIEIKIQSYLKNLGVDFFTHKYIEDISHGYQCDIYIPAMELIIECDGDYWHKYPVGNDLDHIRTSELLSKGFKVLRLWEREIRVMSQDDLKNRLEVINGKD